MVRARHTHGAAAAAAATTTIHDTRARHIHRHLRESGGKIYGTMPGKSMCRTSFNFRADTLLLQLIRTLFSIRSQRTQTRFFSGRWCTWKSSSWLSLCGTGANGYLQRYVYTSPFFFYWKSGGSAYFGDLTLTRSYRKQVVDSVCLRFKRFDGTSIQKITLVSHICLTVLSKH